MITAKNIYNSKAYKQLKEYANGDKQKLKLLVEQYVENYNSYNIVREAKFHNSIVLLSSFAWLRTPQGHDYWSSIDNASYGRD